HSAHITHATTRTRKITDFGLVRSIAAGPELTLSGARIGTPTYMAPEQASGNVSAIGPATDIYALGVVLYELLTGKPPLEGQSAAETIQKVIAEEPTPPSRLNAKVPRDLETICLKCLDKSPARRYGSAQDLADDLHRFLDGKPAIARPVGTLERAIKWARRRPTLALLAAVIFASLAATAVTGAVLWREANLRATERADLRGRARQAVEMGIEQAYEAGKAERWKDVPKIIASAAIHLPEADSPELATRFAEVKRLTEFTEA